MNNVHLSKSWKQTLWKGINVVSSIALIFNMSMVGVLIAPKAAEAAQAAADLDQCRNGAAGSPNDCLDLGGSQGWVNGNAGESQAHYVEGYSIPYRAVLTDLPTGTPITITFGYDIKHGDANAIDYLTSYDRLEPHAMFGHGAENIDPISGVTGVSGAPNTFAIPIPTESLGGQPQASFNALPASEKLMSIWNGTISNITYASEGDLTASQAETVIDITFTATSETVVLSWGGHIASRYDWGDGNSAGAISGSPYHMRLKDWTIGNLGNQDRSLAAAAVINPSDITIVKDAQPDSATVFEYTAPEIGNFTLTDNGTDPNSIYFDNIIDFGTYNVTEVIQNGWDLTGIVCIETVTQDTTTTSDTAIIGLNEGESVTCTFTNERLPGSISGYKWKDLNNNTVWDAGEPGLSGWTINLGGDATASTVTAGDGSYSFDNLNPGNYTVSETQQNNWIQTYPAGNNHNVVLTAGQSVTDVNFGNVPGVCNFELHKTGPATANIGDQITYTITYDNTGTADCTGGGVTITDVIPQYTTYVDHNPKTGSNYDGQQVVWNVGTVSPGESGILTLTVLVQDRPETCGEWTIENRASFWSNQMTGWSEWVYTDVNKPCRATLTVTKHVVNDDGGNAVAADFTMNVTGGNVSDPSFPGDESGTEVTLDIGAYSVDEVELDGYAKTLGADCSGTIAFGEHKYCTITNDDEAPTITLIKSVTNNNGGNAGENDFGLTIGGTPVNSGQTLVVDANTPYALNEAGLAGYTFVSLTGDEECPDVLGGTVTVDEGKDITCTITNDDVAPTITLYKEVMNDDGGNAVPGDFTLTLDGSGVTQGVANQVTANAPHTIDEVAFPGYAFYSLTGDPECPGVLGGTATLDEGENISCTITNDDLAPSITLYKEVINNNGGQAGENDFGLTISGTPVNSGDTLEVAANTPIALNEAGLAGYSFVEITGDAKCPQVLGGTATLDEDEHITCTITNDDIAPKLKLIKTVVNDNGGTLDVPDFPLFIDGNPATSGQWYEVEANVQHQATETSDPGYAASVWSTDCADNGTITLQPGDEKVCTITNDDIAPTITLNKVVNNNHGGNALPSDFTLTLDGSGVTQGLAYEVVANAPHTIDEVALDGYEFVSLSGDEECPDVLGGTATLLPGENIICTITNQDISPSITLYKVVWKNHGGDATENDFGLTIGGTPVNSGDELDVDANTPIALDEAGLTGYTFVSLTGDEECPTELGGTVTLDEGESITCYITNEDIAPTITLIKSVTNDNGGNAGENDFGLTIGGTPVDSGQTLEVLANTPYALNEAGLDGYSFVSLTGAGCPAELGGTVTLNEDEHITCTITNDDEAPTITLIKSVTNNNGGNAGENDFGLTIGGTPVNSGQTLVVDANTPYALNEAGLAGYTFVSLTGDAECPAVLGGTATLDEGEDVTCTITNDDEAPSITLIKDVINDNGGNAGENDFGLTIGGTPVTSGQTLWVDANTPYALNEAGLDGYSFVSLTGEGCPEVLGGEVTLDEGDDITCTITNDDEAPTITLIKSVTNDNGGNALPDDFNLTIGGDPALSGVTYPVMANTAYALDETQLDGYAFVSLTGDEGCPTELGGEVTLNEGEDITCTITNDDIQPKLTVTKIVDNQEFEGKDLADFNLFVDQTQVTSGVQNGFDAGDYVVSETNDPNYTATISGDCDEQGNVTLEVGDEKECTITNVRNTTRITFDKVVIDEKVLGPGTDSDWEFTIDGIGTFSDGDAVTLPTNTSWDVSENDPFPGLYGLTSASGICSLVEGQIVLNVGEQGGTCIIENTRLLPVLGLEKEAPSQVNAGDNIDYTITWSITGNSQATQVVLTDPIPADTTFVSADNGGVYDSTTDTVTWDLGTKQPGDSGTVHMVVQTDTPLPDGTIITNIASLDSFETDPAITAQAETEIVSGPILTIDKTVNVTTFVNPGATVTYTVVVANTGNDTAYNVELTDLLPAGFTFDEFGGTTNTWSLGDLAPGDEVTVTYKVKVASDMAAGTYDNLAVASADNHRNVTDQESVEVRVPQVLGDEAEPKLVITKTVDKDFINPGASAIYTVKVENKGDATAINVQLQDVMPAGFTFEDGTVTKVWQLGDIKAGKSVTITYKAIADKTVKPGVYKNLAIAWADNHGKVSTHVDLEVRAVQVLAEQLPTTGGGLIQYLYLTALALIVASLLYVLRLTPAREES